MKRPAVFGEVLFDCFPDSHEVLGGAPFNVAWHLAGFGCDPLMITGVGDDTRGETILTAMQAWAMSTDGVQKLAYPTGQVRVNFHKGEPTYEIVPDQAYDHLSQASALDALKRCDCGLLYHGSLIARSQSMRELLSEMSHLQTPTFVDVNLRPPWWDISTVRDMVANARWLKLNLDEFITLYLGDAGLASEASIADSDLVKDLATDLVNNSSLELIIVTQGEHGAVCVTSDTYEKGLPVPVDSVVDTVGAGDAFSSVMIAGIINEWPLQVTLDRALEFASVICQNQGATSEDKKLYDRFRHKWS